MLKVSGVNVYPMQAEQVLETYELVQVARRGRAG